MIKLCKGEVPACAPTAPFQQCVACSESMLLEITVGEMMRLSSASPAIHSLWLDTVPFEPWATLLDLSRRTGGTQHQTGPPALLWKE